MFQSKAFTIIKIGFFLRTALFSGMAFSFLLIGCTDDALLLNSFALNNIEPLPAPAEDAVEVVELGKNLFYDKILSGNKNMSCSICHHPSQGTCDGLSLPIGEGGIDLGPVREIADGVVIARNAPGLFNTGQYDVTKMYRDSRVQKTGPNTFLTPEAAISGNSPSRPDIVAQLDSALAAQAIFPITSYAEMRGQPGTNELADAASNEDVWAGIMLRIVGDGTPANPGIEEYIQMFHAAYPEISDVNDFNIGHLGSAIAAFIRQAFQARHTPLDRFIEGEDTAISDIAKIGASVFLGKGRCFVCHNGPHLSNFSHFAIAVPQIGPGVTPNGDDKGRLEATGIFRDRYKFRTPTLRNVSLTGPYMHDGAFTDLTQVTDHYDNLLLSLDTYDGSQIEREEFLGLFEASRVFNINRRNATLLDALIVGATPLNLTDAEKVGLTTFLEEGLTDTSSLDSHVIPTDVPSGLPVD